METGGVDNNKGPSGPSGASDVGASADVGEAEAKADLSDAASAVPDADADKVAAEVVGAVDSVEVEASVDGAAPTSTVDGAAAPDAVEIPETEPTPENRAKAEELRDALHEADALHATDLGLAQDMRSATLDAIAEHAHSITDLAERDRFVRAIGTDAGIAAGKLAQRSPGAATAKLDAITQGVSPDTGRLIARGALTTPGGVDGITPMARSDSPLGKAFAEVRADRQQAMAEVAGGVARTVVPGVDATIRAIEGDYEGAIASAGLDLAGGAIIKGGKYALGAVVGGAAMAPEQAQAGVWGRMTLGLGDDAIEFSARARLADNGRTLIHDVEVPVTFKNGETGSLLLTDNRGKHNLLGKFDGTNLSTTAKRINKGKEPKLNPARHEGQFTGYYNTAAGQAELGRLVAERITPDQLAALERGGRAPIVQLDREVGFAAVNKEARVATSVRIMANRDGGYHLIPMP